MGCYVLLTPAHQGAQDIQFPTAHGLTFNPTSCQRREFCIGACVLSPYLIAAPGARESVGPAPPRPASADFSEHQRRIPLSTSRRQSIPNDIYDSLQGTCHSLLDANKSSCLLEALTITLCVKSMTCLRFIWSSQPSCKVNTVFTPLYGWGNGSPERLSHLPKVTQLGSGRAGTRTLAP